MNRNAGKRKAFTLLEVILAISLTGVVIVLLTTALELLLTLVETSRARIESSQVARGVLNRIASDLRAARFYAPSQNSAEGSSASESDSSSGAEPESESNAESEDSASMALGIFGSAKQLRIDRSAAWRWERITQDDENTTDGAASDEMPETIRYFLNEGDTVLVDTFAGEGIQEQDSLLNYAGLSREQMSTAAWIAQFEATNTEAANTEESEATTDNAQVLAPEVLDIEFAYFDGEEMLDEWDSGEQGKLPLAVEITLKLANEPPIDTSKRPVEDPEALLPQVEDATEYRLFVRLPKIEPPSKVPGPRQIEQKQESH